MRKLLFSVTIGCAILAFAFVTSCRESTDTAQAPAEAVKKADEQQGFVQDVMAEKPKGPVLESLDGRNAIIIVDTKGAQRRVYPGVVLKKGDSFKTKRDTVAQVVYEDGSQVLVSEDTKVTVGPGAVGTTEPQMELHSGEVRALVERIQAKKAGHKFIIKTKSATMGVRGTDFIADARQEKTSIHTISGDVDVAQDMDGLQEGKVTPVAANQYTEAAPDKPIALPKKFKVDKFLKEFEKKNPRMGKLTQVAVKAAKSGELRRKFAKLTGKPIPKAIEKKPEKVKKQIKKKSKKIKKQKRQLKKKTKSVKRRGKATKKKAVKTKKKVKASAGAVKKKIPAKPKIPRRSF